MFWVTQYKLTLEVVSVCVYKHIFVDLVVSQQGSERDVDVVVNFDFEGDFKH